MSKCRFAAISVVIGVLATAISPATAAGKVPVLRPKLAIRLAMGYLGSGNAYLCQTGEAPANGGQPINPQNGKYFEPAVTRGVSFYPDDINLAVTGADYCSAGAKVWPPGFNGYIPPFGSKANCGSNRPIHVNGGSFSATLYGTYGGTGRSSDLRAPTSKDANGYTVPQFPPGYYTATAPRVIYHAWFQKLNEAQQRGTKAPYYKVTVICAPLKLILGEPAPYIILQ